MVGDKRSNEETMTTNLHIQRLDQGYVLTIDGKTEAIGTYDELMTRLVTTVRFGVPNFEKELSIKIDMINDPPKTA